MRATREKWPTVRTSLECVECRWRKPIHRRAPTRRNWLIQSCSRVYVFNGTSPRRNHGACLARRHRASGLLYRPVIASVSLARRKREGPVALTSSSPPSAREPTMSSSMRLKGSCGYQFHVYELHVPSQRRVRTEAGVP